MERRPALAQLALGLGVAIVLMATLIAPLWAIELLLVGVSVWLLWWVAQAPLERLASDRRIPRLMVFGPLGLGIAANLYLVNITARVTLTLNLLVFVATAIVGLYRVFRRPPTGEPKSGMSDRR